MANKIEKQVLADADIPDGEVPQEAGPVYRIMPETRIPVSKHAGKLWKSRRDHAEQVRSRMVGAWDEAIRYFNHDHSEGGILTGSRAESGSKRGDETENLIYANAITMLPAIYSKNPTITAAANGRFEDEALIKTIARLMNVLISQQYLNLKPKLRRQALFALLTNYGWLKLDWVDKEFSSDEVHRQVQETSEKLANAKTIEEVKEAEGELQALEASFDLVADSGPLLCVKQPKQIILDPACEDVTDLTLARWMMEEDFLPTEFIHARYMKKDPDCDEYKSIYAPTHYAASTDGVGDDGVSSIRFLDYASDEKDKQERFDENCYTKVWYVWDRVARRVYMFNDKDWTYPIWVWDDPLGLSRFFPYFGLPFSPTTTGSYGKGEVTYYLDQQDAINQINREQKKVRNWAFNKFFYDKGKITREEVLKIIHGNDQEFVGLEVPEGMKIQDILTPVVPPSAHMAELFNKEDKYKAIDRISAVSDALRGAQFKTNTVQDAVQMYSDAAKIRTGEKVDAIEDMIADLTRSIAELCISKMDSARVAQILSDEEAAAWKIMPVTQFNKSVTLSIVAGSTEKPTSASNQERAIKLGQVIGQFAQAAPGPTLLLILKMLSRAFDETIVSSDEFQQLADTIAGQVSGGAATGEQQPTQPGMKSLPKPDGSADQPNESAEPQSGADPMQEAQSALGAALSMLPPQIKDAIQALGSKGASPVQAIMAVAQQMNQGQNNARH